MLTTAPSDASLCRVPPQYPPPLPSDNAIDLNVVKHQPIVILSAQMLRDIFDVAMNTSRYSAGRSVYGLRPLFLSLVWRAGGDVHELCDGYITPGLVIVSYPVTCFAHRSEVRCPGLLKMEGPFRVRRNVRSSLPQS